MIAYKVCSYYDKKYYSFIHGNIEYKIKETKKRLENCGPFAVFSSLECAKNFANYYKTCSFKIFRCTINKSSATFAWDWTDKTHISKMPLGTILADTVTLLEEVYSNSPINKAYC